MVQIRNFASVARIMFWMEKDVSGAAVLAGLLTAKFASSMRSQEQEGGASKFMKRGHGSLS